MHQIPRVFRGEAAPKVDRPSMEASPSIADIAAYSSNEMYGRTLDERDWDINDIDFTLGGANAVCALEVCASFTKVPKAQGAAGLCVSSTTLNYFPI